LDAKDDHDAYAHKHVMIGSQQVYSSLGLRIPGSWAIGLARHMDLYTHEVFAKFSWEFILDKFYELLVDTCWVPDMDPTPLPRCILTDFPIGVRNAVASYRYMLRQVMMATPDLCTLIIED